MNGEFVESGKPVLHGSNRAFKYGDGLFETIKVANKVPLFFDDHFNRLSYGMNVLKLALRDDFNAASIKNFIVSLMEKNNISSARIRLEVFRDGNGFYLPDSSTALWLMTATELETPDYPHHSEGLKAGIFTDEPKSLSTLSNIKTLNGLIYILAAMNARENGCDENFIINSDGNIIESVSSNVFVVTQGVLLTPPLSQGCLDGVMRKNVIRIALQNGLKVEEKTITPELLTAANEILLSNVIKGIQWVHSFQNVTYSGTFAQKLTMWINSELRKLA
ncbi:MAG TPA: aminotransferase class IV [Bacteroidia bacterium]|nr:aminotransferase class IV [Bacteroidia bacterium]